jgi:hypothetical protein
LQAYGFGFSGVVPCWGMAVLIQLQSSAQPVQFFQSVILPLAPHARHGPGIALTIGDWSPDPPQTEQGSKGITATSRTPTTRRANATIAIEIQDGVRRGSVIDISVWIIAFRREAGR